MTRLGCDKSRRVGELWDRGSPRWASGWISGIEVHISGLQEVSAPSRSQVTDISGLKGRLYLG